MAATGNSRRKVRRHAIPVPPLFQGEPVIHGDVVTLQHWLMHYWDKLQIPIDELSMLAITQDRREFALWTGKRLQTMALGCYCYICSTMKSHSHTTTPDHRHIVFIEPDMQPRSIEVTVAHELIHLADRVKGTPRRHRCHGYDAIALEEAAITGYPIEDLRALLQQESLHRESVRRRQRPIRYIYTCPHCHKQYPRTRKYSYAVSCSLCDKNYNPRFALVLMSLPSSPSLPSLP